MKECFVPKNFTMKSNGIIKTANAIITKYAAQGYDLSLRQLYYQFVAHHGLENREQSYKMLGSVISDARLAGLIDWDHLVDRGRDTIENAHWLDVAHRLESAAKSYRIDLWEDQPTHVEVMVEKQALEGVLEPVCRRLDVPFSSNKGYSSSSALYGVGQRLKEKRQDGKNVVIIYLGDHDPSGIDMTRDVDDRLKLFSGFGYFDEDLREIVDEDIDETFRVNRIALNMPQVRAYNPPPNPAKMTDSRAPDYVRRFGDESWELDALDPEVLAALVTDAINAEIDVDLWNARVELMESGRKEMLALAAERKNEE